MNKLAEIIVDLTLLLVTVVALIVTLPITLVLLFAIEVSFVIKSAWRVHTEQQDFTSSMRELHADFAFWITH